MNPDLFTALVASHEVQISSPRAFEHHTTSPTQQQTALKLMLKARGPSILTCDVGHWEPSLPSLIVFPSDQKDSGKLTFDNVKGSTVLIPLCLIYPTSP